jgi:hypothetical protein
MQMKQAEVAFDIERMKQEAMLKQQLMAEEFKYTMQISQLQAGTLNQRDMQKEKAKDDRVGIQNTQQSKLIEQRKNNLPSLNFESNEDSLDGFDFAEFEPR